MKSTFRSFLAAALLFAACALAQAESQTLEFNSLTGKQGYPAITDGRATYTDRISAVFTRPDNAVGNVPVMVILHSSAGVMPEGTGEWSKFFLRMGIATLVVDSFTPRGIQSTTKDQYQLSNASSVVDALMALREVAKLPGVDVTRIGSIGFSRGALASFGASSVRIRQAVLGADSKLKYALNIAFYNGCSTVGTTDPKQPMLMLMGDADGAIPVDTCKAVVETLVSRGADVKMVVYPGATHGFDVSRPVSGKDYYVGLMQTWAKCGVSYTDLDKDNTYFIGKETVDAKTFGELRGKCMSTGVTLRTSDSARKSAQDEVTTFVRKNFAM